LESPVGRKVVPSPNDHRGNALHAGSRRTVRVDLGDEAQITNAVRTVMDRYGRLDCAANCAGFDFNANFLDCTAADCNRICGTNVRGLFLCMREEVGVDGKKDRQEKPGANQPMLISTKPRPLF
jgi:NAD(P)-dependent dehydrogenase (short-subunit alcohol dehydrogenase family)